jgi:hypothetical protein
MTTFDPILEDLTQEPIPPLLKDDGQPIFKDSWEAEAFAIGNLLIKQGFLSCSEWVEIFSQEIKKPSKFQISNDDSILPGADGKIVAWVEED